MLERLRGLLIGGPKNLLDPRIHHHLALIAFSRMHGSGDGQVFALIVMVVAAWALLAGVTLLPAVLGLLASGSTGLRGAALQILLAAPDRVATVRKFITYSRQLAGWVRDRAQQILVEEGAEDAKAKAALREFLAATEEPLARVHALWALQGVRALTPEFLKRALADPDERVREAAVRAGELFAGADPAILGAWLAIARA